MKTSLDLFVGYAPADGMARDDKNCSGYSHGICWCRPNRQRGLHMNTARSTQLQNRTFKGLSFNTLHFPPVRGVEYPSIVRNTHFTCCHHRLRVGGLEISQTHCPFSILSHGYISMTLWVQ